MPVYITDVLFAATPTATAFAIKSLHAAKTGAADARKKAKWLGGAFIVSIVQKVASTYAPGILYDWHIFYEYVHPNDAFELQNADSHAKHCYMGRPKRAIR